MDRNFVRFTGPLSPFALFAAFLFTLSCTTKKLEQPDPNAPRAAAAAATAIKVSWAANHEVGVNSAGGGYRVYYSTSSGVNTSTASYVDVPYVSGLTAPTTATLTGLSVGTYYVRVVAYSAYNPKGVAGGNRSSDSAEGHITVQ